MITLPGIGSIRPVVGEDLGLVRVRVELAWDRLDRSAESESVETRDIKNSTFRHGRPWQMTSGVNQHYNQKDGPFQSFPKFEFYANLE